MSNWCLWNKMKDLSFIRAFVHMSVQCISGMFAMCFTPTLISVWQSSHICCVTFCKLLDQNRLGSAKGGPYLGVHLRRKDFIWGHRDDVPSLKGAVKKIRSLMKKHKLQQVFVATDADGEGTDTIKKNWKKSKTTSYKLFKLSFRQVFLFCFTK